MTSEVVSSAVPSARCQDRAVRRSHLAFAGTAQHMTDALAMRARKYGQHFLSRRGPTSSSRRSRRSRRSLPRDRARARRADAAAGAAGGAPDRGRDRSRTWSRRCAAGCRRTSRSCTRDFLDFDLASLAGRRAAPRRRQPSLQRLVADPVPRCWLRTGDRRGSSTRPLMLQREVAERHRGAAGHAATTACSRSWCSCTPTCGGC